MGPALLHAARGPRVPCPLPFVSWDLLAPHSLGVGVEKPPHPAPPQSTEEKGGGRRESGKALSDE